MRKTLSSLGLVAAALMFSAPSQARTDTVAGAVIGGAAGGVIGAQVGGDQGAAIGALLGAVAGAGLAESQRRDAYHGYYSQRIAVPGGRFDHVYQRPLRHVYPAPQPVVRVIHVPAYPAYRNGRGQVYASPHGHHHHRPHRHSHRR
ncbi:glycine zipper domain-containing protein [Sinimarinibacterium sp. NLF-5-8]|uniref:YMGG-like glycine zipper-containing protein n=1 Tax=Sinimarinibacterium sp. NLF-5-8 TaxID=2698684 RepID=UPI00137C158C|nr:glycine zipper domain-containing protein [Sinimarinibacterium sp. NLF-5-8]QHS09925.1 glycine zipper 2TM domain-containing protein [Sinimarinibacterium sp. NLF-5-8]